MRVVWSKRATARVVEIARYIAVDSPQAAERWSEALISAVDGLGDFPGMGKLARDVATPGVHELVFGDFRVFYEVTANIDILTVRRARQLIDEGEFRSGD
jgi:plasmid stabilization system protein ParE